MMRRSTWIMLSGWMAGLALALGGAWAGAARAADVLFVADQPEPAAEASPAHPSEYWIGLECVPVEPALRSQLGLAEHEGVMVASVMPESPAAKAGIKPHDVLVKAGDKPLRGIKVLVEAVEQSKDKPLTLELFRDGKSQKVEVTPAKRPSEIRVEEEERWNDMPLPPVGFDPEQMRKWFEKVHPDQPMRFFFSRPGVILPKNAGGEALPENLSIAITRSGKQPAKIVVKRDKDQWEVTEKELEKLPADVRPHVERMLGRGANAGYFLFKDGLGNLPGPPHPGAVMPEVRPDLRLEKRMEVLERRLDQLHKTLDELRKSHPEAQSPPEKK
jgi:membrane-associated protease RseP (regulator of RpoE activity)